jgi:hypothetical protein
MALKPLNTLGGVSVGLSTPTDVILSNGDVVAANLNVSGSSELGGVSNVKITGGTSGQFLKTDGNGNLSWSSTAGGAGTLYVVGRAGVIPITITGGILPVVGRSGIINVLVI